MTKTKNLSEIALRFEGVQEIPNNQGWKDEFLSLSMDAVGFKKGWAWCMLFAQVCVELYYSQFDSSLINKYRECFSPSVVTTFRNFKKNYLEMVSNVPTQNSVCFWQHYVQGKPTAQGHAGIVLSFDNTFISTVDGNTNEAGSREGDGVYRKKRLIKYKPDNGLRILGYINFKYNEG